MVRQFLEEHKLSHRVDFKGNHCFGDCENGPSIRIEDHKFDHISKENIREILENELLNKSWD